MPVSVTPKSSQGDHKTQNLLTANGFFPTVLLSLMLSAIHYKSDKVVY